MPVDRLLTRIRRRRTRARIIEFAAGPVRLGPRFSIGRPSLSRWFVNGAVRRLPDELSDAERERWAEEMRADVASVKGRIKRLRCAYRLWRKGAPEMPVGSPEAPRSAD
ncbi:MAG TPA: hypothetical protein VFY48_08520 [Solirubrobacterales bacterium]|nr:hypothetical protein [Solirubrobacterales bacterium]